MQLQTIRWNTKCIFTPDESRTPTTCWRSALSFRNTCLTHALSGVDLQGSPNFFRHRQIIDMRVCSSIVNLSIVLRICTCMYVEKCCFPARPFLEVGRQPSRPCAAPRLLRNLCFCETLSRFYPFCDLQKEDKMADRQDRTLDMCVCVFLWIFAEFVSVLLIALNVLLDLLKCSDVVICGQMFKFIF